MMKRLGVVISVVAIALFIFSAIADAADYVETNLVSYWALDGDMTDEQGLNDGAEMSNTTFVAGHNGQAASFSGDGFIRIADSDSLDLSDALTVEAYVYKSSHIVNQNFLGKANAYRMGDSNLAGRASTYISPGGTPKKLNLWSAIPLDTWFHVAITYDKDATGKNYKAYVNGVLDLAQLEVDGSIPADGNDFFIGAFTKTYYHFTGMIDDVRIYDRALTPEEIVTNYNSTGVVIPEPSALLLMGTGLLSLVSFRWKVRH